MHSELSTDIPPKPSFGHRVRLAWRWIWPMLRITLGWLCIVIGIAGLILPLLNGVIFLLLGIALVGRRNWLIRWVAVHVKILLRLCEAHPNRALAWIGRMARQGQQQISRQRRRLYWRWEERRRRQLDG